MCISKARPTISVDGRNEDGIDRRSNDNHNRNRIPTMKNPKSGEFMLISAAIALAGSLIVSYFTAANEAQLEADATGREVSVMDKVDGDDAKQALIATLGGAGIGWGIDQLKDDDKKDQDQKPPTIQVTSGRDTVFSIGGDGTSANNDQSQPVTTNPQAPAPAATAVEVAP